MAIGDTIKYHRHPAKLPSNRRLGPSGNVNAHLHFLTLDDIIFRYMWNANPPGGALRKVSADAYHKQYRQQYGRKTFKGKTVLVRAGIDAPVDEHGRITGTERIRLAIPTLEELSDYGARVVVIGHQGRAGKSDFIGLEQHARIIRKFMNPLGSPKKNDKISGQLDARKSDHE